MGADRSRFLDEACGPDAQIRRDVEALLDQDSKSGGFLNRPVIGVLDDSGNSTMADDPKQDSVSASRMAPWWVCVVAASFVLCFLLIVYLDFVGPGLRVFSGSRQSVLVVTVVSPRSPGDVSGLRPGDRIISIDGRSVDSYIEWVQFLFDVRVGQTIHFEIERANKTLSLTATPERKSFVGYDSSPLAHALIRIGQGIALVLACFVASVKPRNRTALMAALFVAALSMINNPQRLIGAGVVLHDLPAIPLALVWVVAVSMTVVAPVLFTFCATFPVPLIRSRWIWAIVWTPPLLWLVPRLSVAYQMMYYPNQPNIFHDWVHVGLNSLSAGYFVGGPIAMAVNYRRLTDINERRRIQILVIGSALGFLALAPSMLAGQQSRSDSNAARQIFLLCTDPPGIGG